MCGRENEIKFSKECMKCHVIKMYAQSELHLASNRSISHQHSYLFSTSGQSQAASSHMLSLMITSKGIIGLVWAVSPHNLTIFIKAKLA